MSITRRNHTKPGFTLIEVVLFLAISSAVLITILSSTSQSLARQRYNDSIQDLFSFLQSQYSAVINVQNSNGQGDSPDYLIYGKIIVFEGDTAPSGGSIINVYTVVGNIEFDKTNTIDNIFNSLDLKAVCNENTSYTTQWGAIIQDRVQTVGPLKQTIAILRSPTNGTVYTYKNKTNSAVVTKADCEAPSSSQNRDLVSSGKFSDSFTLAISNDNTTANAVDLCIYTDDAPSDKRRDIRISSKNSINSVYLIPLDVKEKDEANSEDMENRC